MLGDAATGHAEMVWGFFVLFFCLVFFWFLVVFCFVFCLFPLHGSYCVLEGHQFFGSFGRLRINSYPRGQHCDAVQVRSAVQLPAADMA